MKHVTTSGGKFHIWCDVTNEWVLKNATRQEIIDFFIKIAASRAYDTAIDLCDQAQPKKVH
jgi:hypothetical protein